MLCDSHIHCAFSSDSTTDPVKIIEKSISLGISKIWFTDHCDMDYPDHDDLFVLDFPSYFLTLKKLQTKYKSQIQIFIGVEMGLQPHLANRIQTLVDSYPFDFVIGSTHTVSRKDPAFPSFYHNRSIEEGLHSYFQEILQNLSITNCYDTCAHLDYAVRYLPDKDRDFHLEKYMQDIELILQYLIEHDKSLEVNTGGFRCGLGRTNPGNEILRRYYELGGTNLTIGSDAHTPEYLASNFEEVTSALSHIGFDHFCIYENRQKINIPF